MRGGWRQSRCLLSGALQNADRLLERQSLCVEEVRRHAAAVADKRSQNDRAVYALPATLLGGECGVAEDFRQLLRDGRRAAWRARSLR